MKHIGKNLVSILVLVSGSSCSKVSDQIQQALSSVTKCESKTEYQFALPSTVANPLVNFTASSVGGSAKVVSDGCSSLAPGSISTLPPEHTIARTSQDLKVTVGALAVMNLKINANQLSGTLADTCQNGNRVIHTLESGEVTSSPKGVKVTVNSKVVLAGCN